MIKINENKVLEILQDNAISETEKLTKIQDEIELQIYNKTLKSTEKKCINAIKRFAKSTLKDVRQGLQGAFLEDNRITVCNGYIAIKMYTDNVVGITMKDNDSQVPNINYLLDSVKNNDVEINIDKQQVMLQYKKHKALKEKNISVKNHGIYIVEYKQDDDTKYIGFNVKLLKDIIDMLGDNIQFYNSELNKDIKYNNNAVYVKSEIAEGLICPIRITQKSIDEYKNNK